MSTTRTFHELAVIGAGNMGAGIAQKMATEGFPVLLVDVDEERVRRGVAIVETTLAQGVERRIFKAEQARQILERVRGTASWDDLRSVDLVVEAVFEDLAVKREVFARLDEVCRPDAILATNTSSLSVAELARATRRPERVLGLHYFYHPAKNRLVEVVPGPATDPALTRACWSLQEQLGKTPIASADAPGFIVNRFFVPWLNEAVRLLEEGAADIPTIELAAREAFGAGMGPFELMNVTGLPIALHAATTLGCRLGPFYAPAATLARQVESGRTWELAGTPDATRTGRVAERLEATVFHVAASLVNEEVGTVEDTDIGARVGLRWPRGPFELMNRRGVGEAARMARDLARRWDMPPPRLLEEHGATGRPFTFTLVRTEQHDGIATLTINRPDAMNALNEEVVAQLGHAFRAAAGDPRVRGIVLAGAGKAFVAGADIRFFVRHMEAGTLDPIVAFTEAGHALLAAIDNCGKPVVARVQGLTLGGGLELALACDRIVAAPRATFAFPETGIGIYPGLGGTQRTPRRIGAGLARWLIFTGQTLAAEDALAIGLVDRVAPLDQLDRAVVEAIEQAGTSRARPQAPDRFAALGAFFARSSAESLRTASADALGDESLVKAMQRVAGKAPLALDLAERLIEEGAALPLDRALRLELDALRTIFASADAREGLSTLGQRKPVFTGR